MYEVILTYRPDFHETLAERCNTEEQAQNLAANISAQPDEQLIRVWIRYVREVKARQR